jgi:hypothetical protein
MAAAIEAAPLSSRAVLWIDRVGSVLLLGGSRITIGGPATDNNSADLSLLAHLSRMHLTIRRGGDRYVVTPHAAAQLNGRGLYSDCDLVDGSELTLGSNFRFRFRQPNSMSASARLEMLSDHRWPLGVDAVVLLDETCLLGPGTENHVRCPAWSSSVLLYRQADELWCRSRETLFVDGKHAPEGGKVSCGTVITGPELRFRVESTPVTGSPGGGAFQPTPRS